MGRAGKVEVVGTPTAAVVATAVGGQVSRLDVAAKGGTVLVEGHWRRPLWRPATPHLHVAATKAQAG